MKIFENYKKKKLVKEALHNDFDEARIALDNQFQASQLIKLDGKLLTENQVRDLDWSITGSYANYKEWHYPSGTAITFDPYKYPVLSTDYQRLGFEHPVDILTCSHCGKRYLFNKENMKDILVNLSCVACGAEL